ncbi:trypsin-related protease [Cordyceps fumosorosea ARSEF 2679]|uniref:Trypsin-related protease n=1 Tax=Cordyceps fumosorosea (strain ARSEF 2679) TaxID=1081104 RepID=A0A167W1E7_CORFA|nr:trypsin-related protease [Cordyceps fumosorosea ARSEF 2679]OAA63216.1 trypsin-related protease [Cordyceps fumosorosea ARSEF 2679]
MTFENLSKITIPIHARESGSGKSPCKFDSGSGLIDQKTGQVIGVASFVIKDKNSYYCDQAPTVFTRVGSYMSFIKQHLEGADAAAAKPDPVPATNTTKTEYQGPRAKEDELRSTAVKPNKYGIPEDECRRMVAQCVFEEAQKKEVAQNFDGVIECMDSQFRGLEKRQAGNSMPLLGKSISS